MKHGNKNSATTKHQGATRWTFIRRVASGNPLTLIGPAFIDLYSGKQISYYSDRDGQMWLSEDQHKSAIRIPLDRRRNQNASLPR